MPQNKACLRSFLSIGDSDQCEASEAVKAGCRAGPDPSEGEMVSSSAKYRLDPGLTKAWTAQCGTPAPCLPEGTNPSTQLC